MVKDTDFDASGVAYPLEKDDIKNPLEPPSNRSYWLTIIGVLLIIAGVLAIVNWSSIFLLIFFSPLSYNAPILPFF